jgi:hypothetical protein
VELRRAHPVAAARERDDVRIGPGGRILQLDAHPIGEAGDVALEALDALDQLCVGETLGHALIV